MHFCTTIVHPPEKLFFYSPFCLSMNVPLISPKCTRYHWKCLSDILYLAPHDLVGEKKANVYDSKQAGTHEELSH